MTTYREINELQRDPKRAAELAGFLLGLDDVKWGDWPADFLESATRWGGHSILSTRQAEKLIELRDSVGWFASVGGFSVAALLRGCFEGRRELQSIEDEEYVARLWAGHREKVRRRDLGFVLRLSRELGIIEDWHARSFDKRPTHWGEDEDEMEAVT